MSRSMIFAGGCALALALLVAYGYYVDSRAMRVTALTTDQLGTLSICVRKDHPNMLLADMVAGERGSERFYLPVYVDLVRLLSLPDSDYLAGLSRLLALTTVVYICGWWLLFNVYVGPWVGVMCAFLVRAVLPLPGGETWGVGGLWTMLARTLFLALLPWGLWLWVRYGRRLATLFASCLFMGLLVNIHPLSGLVVLGGVLAGESARVRMERMGWKSHLARLGIVALGGFLGAVPFLRCYHPDRGSVAYTIGEYRNAMSLRVPHDVLYPDAYLRQWGHPLLLMAMLAPFVLIVCMPSVRQRHGLRVRMLVSFALGCVGTAWLAVLCQFLLQELGRPVFFATYMIRGMKYVLVPAILLWAMLVNEAKDRITRRWRWGRPSMIGALVLAIGGSLAIRASPLARTPAIAESPIRFFWPEWVGPRLPPVTAGQNDGIEVCLDWIRKNTATEARFVGPLVLRVDPMRSVVHDHKGASLLIENNPSAFLAWARRQRELLRWEREDPSRLPEIYRSWGADYWVTTQRVDGLVLAYRDDVWTVYDLRTAAAGGSEGGKGP